MGPEGPAGEHRDHRLVPAAQLRGCAWTRVARSRKLFDSWSVFSRFADELVQLSKSSRQLRLLRLVVRNERPKLLQKLIAARELQPPVLHFEEIPPGAGVTLALGPFRAFLSALQAFADVHV